MTDLSQYINFGFQIDISGINPVCLFTDYSSYPPEAVGFQGFVTITQPDGISTISSTTADITDLNRATTKPYRMAAKSGIQNGNYTVSYTVKCDGFSDTTVIKSVSVKYSTPTIVITPKIDVYVPSVRVVDDTNLIVNSFSLTTVTNDWKVTISSINGNDTDLTGSGNTLSLSYQNNYYDAAYTVTLTDTFLFTSEKSNWFSIKDKSCSKTNFDVYSPTSADSLQSAIDQLHKSGADCSCDDSCSLDGSLQGLLNYITGQIAKNETEGLQVKVMALEDLLFPDKTRTHTNTPISATTNGLLFDSLVYIRGAQVFSYQSENASMPDVDALQFYAIRLNVSDTGKWQYQTPTGVWNDIPGATDTTYSLTHDSLYFNGGDKANIRYYVNDVIYDVTTAYKLYRGANIITTIVTSTMGTTFLNRNVDTYLYATVYSGSTDITGTITPDVFIWSRTSYDAVADAAWNAAHSTGAKSIHITSADVKGTAGFKCTTTINI